MTINIKRFFLLLVTVLSLCTSPILLAAGDGDDEFAEDDAIGLAGMGIDGDGDVRLHESGPGMAVGGADGNDRFLINQRRAAAAIKKGKKVGRVGGRRVAKKRPKPKVAVPQAAAPQAAAPQAAVPQAAAPRVPVELQAQEGRLQEERRGRINRLQEVKSIVTKTPGAENVINSPARRVKGRIDLRRPDRR